MALEGYLELFHTTAKNLIATPMVTALDDSSNAIRSTKSRQEKDDRALVQTVSGSKEYLGPQIRTRW